jgi:hypothetical protein
MDCNSSYLPAEHQVQTLLRTNGTLNGLGVVEIPNTNLVPAINCDNNHLTFVDLLLLSIGVDGCGSPALRVSEILSCDLVKNCENNNFDFLNTIFAYDTVLKVYVLVLVKSNV